MYALIVFGLLAAASAAPQFHMRRPPPPHYDHLYYRANGYDNVFDAPAFWTDLETKMMRLDEILNDFYSHFPTRSGDNGIVGDEYRITINLAGFDEKDIVVKARTGVVMIQAVSKVDGNPVKTYMDVRTLPDNVNPDGSWVYDKNVLKITLPLINKPAVSESTDTEEDATTAQPEEHSREEMNPEVEEDRGDIEVGLNNKQAEILTNEIPNSNQGIEATTYAVDVKDQYEFVPVQY